MPKSVSKLTPIDLETCVQGSRTGWCRGVRLGQLGWAGWPRRSAWGEEAEDVAVWCEGVELVAVGAKRRCGQSMWLLGRGGRAKGQSEGAERKGRAKG
eukprot:408899-Rhodomonas_salina.1